MLSIVHSHLITDLLIQQADSRASATPDAGGVAGLLSVWLPLLLLHVSDC